MVSFSIVNTKFGSWEEALLGLALHNEEWREEHPEFAETSEYDVDESIIMHSILAYGHHIMGLVTDEELLEDA